MVMLLVIISVTAIEECQRHQLPKDLPCMIYSTWKPIDCAAYNITVYNSTDEVIQIRPWGNLTTICNTTFNLTQGGIYFYNSSIESGIIEIEAEDNMTSLAITIFLLLFNIGIFILPAFFRFSSSEMWHKIIAKCIYIFGMALIVFNLNVFVKLADNAGLGINDQLFLYQRYIMWGLYVAMIFLFYNMITSALSMWKLEKKKKRMGEE